MSRWQEQYNPGCCCPMCIQYEKEKLKDHDWDEVVPSVPTSRLPDQSAYDLVSSEEVNKIIITGEDINLIKLFLGKLKDQTLSRSIHKVLTDLIGRLS